jgi:hypothetical protein
VSTALSASGRSLVVNLCKPELHNSFSEVSCCSPFSCLLSPPTQHFCSNPKSQVLIKELSDVFREGVPSSVRCVVLASQGKSFSAGADVNYMKKMAGFTREQNKEDSRK